MLAYVVTVGLEGVGRIALFVVVPVPSYGALSCLLVRKPQANSVGVLRVCFVANESFLAAEKGLSAVERSDEWRVLKKSDAFKFIDVAGLKVPVFDRPRAPIRRSSPRPASNGTLELQFLLHVMQFFLLHCNFYCMYL